MESCGMWRQARRRLAWALVAWAAALGHWLGWAYSLEHRGADVFLGVWVASLGFLAAQTALLLQVLAALPAGAQLPCVGGQHSGA